jgi:hypothetical protein
MPIGIKDRFVPVKINETPNVNPFYTGLMTTNILSKRSAASSSRVLCLSALEIFERICRQQCSVLPDLSMTFNRIKVILTATFP